MQTKIEKFKEFIHKNLKWIILFLSVIIFLKLAEDVFEKEIMKADILGYQIISTYLISDFITPVAKFITQLGGAVVLVSITLIILLVVKNKKIGMAVALNLTTSTVLNLVLKNIVQRPRPTQYRLIDESRL